MTSPRTVHTSVVKKSAARSAGQCARRNVRQDVGRSTTALRTVVRAATRTVREEELVRQFGELLRQVRIPTELAGKLETVLRESQTDKEKFVRTSILRLQQQQLLLRSKLDRVYEDRLSDQIPEELWTAKSVELQQELRRVRTEMERHEIASQAYRDGGTPDSRTRANCVFLVCCKESERTGASRQNTRIELDVPIAEVSRRPTLSRSMCSRMVVKTGDWLLGLDSNQQPSG